MPDRQHRFPFTQARLKTLPAPAEGRTTWYDSKTPGLCLRKTYTGAAAFYLYRWHAGKPTRIHLGAFPALSLTNARDAAAAAMGDMAKGAEPAIRRAKTGGRITLADLWVHYLDQHAKPHKRTWRVDEQRYNRHLKTWAGRRLVAISTADVQALHNRVGKESGQYEANRLRSLLHAMYAIARRHLGYRGDNPVTNVQRFKEESRERFSDGDVVARILSGPRLPTGRTPYRSRCYRGHALDRRTQRQCPDYDVGGIGPGPCYLDRTGREDEERQAADDPPARPRPGHPLAGRAMLKDRGSFRAGATANLWPTPPSRGSRS